MYLMFIGPWEGGGPWNSRGIEGVARFLQRVWTLVGGARQAAGPRSESAARAKAAITSTPANGNSTGAAGETRDLLHWTHKTIRKVTEDLGAFHFNTAIAALMEFVNYLHKVQIAASGTPAWREALKSLVLLLAPMAPHIAEELWERLDEPYSVHLQPWPKFDPMLAQAQLSTLIVQVDGKVRDRVEVPVGISEPEAKALALRNPKVIKFIDGKSVRDVIVVPGRLVNVVTGERT
jgi:leucyl-tRNA synthetase